MPSEISQHYQQIFERHYKEKHKNRVYFLGTLFKKFDELIQLDLDRGPESENHSSTERFEPIVNLHLLDHLVTSYFYDVIRYKEFHFPLETRHECKENEDRINRYKIAAYTVKWIVRVKPLFIDDLESTNPMSEKQDALITTLNEQFAVFVATYILGINELYDEDFNDLVYQLCYRPYDEGAFELVFKNIGVH